MIRRLLLAIAVVVGFLAVGTETADAANVACIYNLKPLDIGLCIGV